MDDSTIKERAQAQFGAVAERYVTSPIHAHGSDLQRMIELAQPKSNERALDIATGGGHTALAFAPHVATVVASDLTLPMLQAAEAFIRSKGMANVTFERADAEALPFGDAEFDIVTCRIAPHHFPNPDRFVAEVARVLRPGGRFVLDDNMSPPDPELDAFMDKIERWRDPSHVRNYSVAEWTGWMEQSGLAVEHVEPLAAKVYDFADWIGRMNMPQEEQAALEAWLLNAPARCAEYFKLNVEDGRVRSITGTYGIIVARKP